MTNTFKNHSAATHSAQQRSKNAAAVTTDDTRKKFIKAIKTKQRQLGMTDEVYRAMLLARTGHSSATLCNLHQLGLVNEYLSGQGATNPKGLSLRGKRPAIATDRQALRGKVNALMAELVRLADITDPVKYVNAICVRNGWCTTLDFADPHTLHKLVGALSRTVAGKTKAANTAASST